MRERRWKAVARDKIRPAALFMTTMRRRMMTMMMMKSMMRRRRMMMMKPMPKPLAAHERLPAKCHGQRQ